METTRSIRKALSPGDWVTSINLKDAYFHIPVHPDFRKYLRIVVGGKVFQFKALPFGLSPAPREFSWVTGVLGTLLHKLTIYLHLYLNNWLLRATSRAICLAHTQIALEKAQTLGFLVNWAKSELVPTQRFVFLREAHFLLQLLGVLNSVADIIPYGRLHMRPLQLFLIAHWSMASQPLCFLVRLNKVFFHHLGWWEDRHNLTCGVPLTSPKTSSTLCTDSLIMGWGATLDAGDSVSGTWTLQEAEESINFLEMMAIYLALCYFSSRLWGQTILIRTDNLTCIPYLKRQGGTKVPRLTYLTWKLFHPCMDHNIQLVMVHLAGKLNSLADQLSRVTRPVATEWALNSHIFRAITQNGGSQE